VTFGSKQIKRMTCIACNEIIGDHSFNKLGKCLVRVQASIMLDGMDKQNKKNKELVSTTKDVIDASDKDDISIPKNDIDDGVEMNNIETSDGSFGLTINNEIK